LNPERPHRFNNYHCSFTQLSDKKKRTQLFYYANKRRQRKPKGALRIDNPETHATLGTQDTERRKIKQTNTQDRKLTK